MKNIIVRGVSLVCAMIVTFSLLLSNYSVDVSAATSTMEDDTMVVVSLGDSYSSGEGIEPFYGQEKDLEDRVLDEDWLAHRSELSWPGLIEIPGVSGKMADYKEFTSGECQWYFKASSGAETKHFKNSSQTKTIWKNDIYDDEKHYEYLEPQLNVFDDINETVDYVTLTVGGNDVNFAGIITMCATKSTYLHFSKEKLPLQKKMDDLWASFSTTRSNIKQTYKDIAAVAPEADIIVAGYPKLLEQSGKGKLISKEEAKIVNSNVSKFNDEIEAIVKECQQDGIKIHFVDVEEVFNGHEAYSSRPWINEIMFTTPGDQDLMDLQFRDIAKTIASAYSVHPNQKGAEAYARCVNAKIAEIENSKHIGVLSGKIVQASNRSLVVPGAKIDVYKNNQLVRTVYSDTQGNYALTLSQGDYLISISAPGFINFRAFATVVKDTNTYMESFLLISGTLGDEGGASGMVRNSLTGQAAAGVKLTVKENWNNFGGVGKTVATATTDINGNYTMNLPIGNYTVIATKDGYRESIFNIVAIPDVVIGNQNGTITPIVSDNNYLITLTWGENPRDLDSHVVGKLCNGNSFHVYYGNKSVYDGDNQVCYLDYDDTTSYGPEHITLKNIGDTPYYYYIYKYAGTGTVASSGAKIKVEQGNNLIAEFNVPTDLGDGRYWNVFAIENGEFKIKNTITDLPDTSYAE